MRDWSVLHARLVRKATDLGAPVLFSRDGMGAYDGVTGEWAGAAAGSVAGQAIEVKADAAGEQFALGLTIQDVAVLVFVPTTFGQAPATGDAVTWAGEKRTVKKVRPVRPAGESVASFVAVG